MRPVRGRRIYVTILVAASVVSRLPQLLSPNLLVDGDEAVLGLMARHLLVGREFPLFFWGQHYGFSSVEAGAAALGFAVAGTGAIPLKLAMLAIWTLGVVFLFLALEKMVGSDRGFWITAAFVLMPAWAVWSMKARGGYLTSFAATGALLWLLVQDDDRQTPARWAVAGALTFLVYLAQPLWLPGLLPVVIAALISRRSLRNAASYVVVIGAAVLMLRTSTAGSAGPVLGNFDVPGSVPLMGRQIYELLKGTGDFSWFFDPPGPITHALAVFWCGLLAATVPLQLYRLVTRKYCRWSHVLFLALFFTLASELVLLHARDARYLLPIGALLDMLAGVELVDLIDRGIVPGRIATGITVGVLVLGSVSMWEFRNFTPLWANSPKSLSERERFRRVFTYLRVEGVKHVFSMNGLLDTQLMFYSDEAVVARWATLDDRYPPYVDEVDRALADGERVAVVGYTNTSGAPGCSDVPICTGGIERLAPDPETIYSVDGRYFIYVGANGALLEKLHFRFPD